MGFFDDVFGDPEKQLKKDIERWKKEDELFMEEVRKDDRRWQQAGGDPELYDELKRTEEIEEDFRKSMKNLEKRRQRDMASLAMSDRLGSFAAGVQKFSDRAYRNSLDREADRLVRELEEESKKY